MKNPKLSNRYANALYKFSVENQQLEDVYQDILLIQRVFHENRELHLVVESPVIFPNKKIRIFSEIFENKLSSICFGFLKLVIMKKREPALLLICDEFIKFYYKHHNIKIAHITVAHPLENKLIEKLKALLEEQTATKIEIRFKTNPAIVGGFIIKIDDFVFDSSIISKINKLKREFSYNIYQPDY